jgi:hypothetical protein
VNQDGAEVQGGVDARQELEKMRARMAEIKQEVATDVDQKWGSPFRTQELFDLKVKTRLSSHHEYRSLQSRVQEAETALAAGSDTATDAGSAR